MTQQRELIIVLQIKILAINDIPRKICVNIIYLIFHWQVQIPLVVIKILLRCPLLQSFKMSKLKVSISSEPIWNHYLFVTFLFGDLHFQPVYNYLTKNGLAANYSYVTLSQQILKPTSFTLAITKFNVRAFRKVKMLLKGKNVFYSFTFSFKIALLSSNP